MQVHELVVRTITRPLKKLRWLPLSPYQWRHSWVGPPRRWKMRRDFQIRFLKQVGLQPQHYLLDLGCGTLLGGIPAIDYLQPGHYYGIEVRGKVVREARKELREAKLEYKEPVLILSEDISSLDIGREFDFICAFSVLIHMRDEILNDSLDFVRKHLKSTGCFFANVTFGKKGDGYWQGFPIVWRSLEFYEQMSMRHGLRVSDIGTLKSLGHISGNPTHDAQRMLKFRKV